MTKAEILASTSLPRPRSAERTREAILRAAGKIFSEKGYASAGLREIAAAAGVNVALVNRYFGSKESLLRLVLEDLLSVQPIIEGDRARFGERAAEMLIGTSDFGNPAAIVMLGMSDPDARILCGDLVQQRVILPLAEWLGGGDALDRAAQLAVLWTGFITQRQLTPLPQLDDSRVRPTRLWIAEISQSIADRNAP